MIHWTAIIIICLAPWIDGMPNNCITYQSNEPLTLDRCIADLNVIKGRVAASQLHVKDSICKPINMKKVSANG
jgi:hypothetical protein